MATIVMHARDSTQSDAFLVNFTNGRLNTDDGIRLRMYESTRSKKMKSLVAETDDITFIGKTTDLLAPKAAAHSNKYIVAIVNKKQQKMRLYDTEMFNLQPQIKDTALVDEGPVETMRDKIDSLTSAFGGSKKKRAMESRRKNEILGSKLETVITEAASEAMINEDILKTPTQQSHPLTEVLPPFDLEANNPLQAYPFNGIISREVLQACKIPGQMFADATNKDINTWKAEKTYPSYILQYLSRLPISAEARLHKAACLVYLNHLMFMFRITFRELTKRDAFPREMPTSVKRTLTESFTVMVATIGRKPTMSMPARMKDKTLSYLLLLALHLDEFKLDYNLLLVDLKIGQLRMRNHLQAIGCKVTIDKSTKVQTATLKTPLQFAETPLKRGPKRR